MDSAEHNIGTANLGKPHSLFFYMLTRVSEEKFMLR